MVSGGGASNGRADPRTFSQLRSALVRAAEQFGTPVYVMDMVSVATAARQVESAFRPPWLLHYSLKANDLPAVAGYLAERGWGAAVVSTGEWQHARSGGVPNAAVVFEGIGKTDPELAFAVAEAAAGRAPRWLVAESAAELSQLARLAAGRRLGRDGRPPLDVLLRLNPGVSPETRPQFAVGSVASKFGLPASEIRALARTAVASGPGLRVRGVHVHVGSALTDVTAWARAGASATALLGEIARWCPEADTVDYGGGFPLPAPGRPTPAQFLAALQAELASAGLSLPRRPAIEPGRYLVGGAGWLVSSVLHARGPLPAASPADGSSANGSPADGSPGDGGPAASPPSASRSSVSAPAAPEITAGRLVLDAGMTELIRPALYGSVHRVLALRSAGQQAGSLRPTIVDGPICELTDSFGTYELPPLARGDLVAIDQAGAYAASFTSRYNGRPQPAEVVVQPDGDLALSDRPEVRSAARQVTAGRTVRSPQTSLA